MTKRFFLFPFLLAALFAFSSCYGQTQQDIKRSIYLQKMIQDGVRQEHFQPKQLDDEFSEKAFDEYLKSLDYNKRFFIQEDIDALSEYRREIDDQYTNTQLDFFYLSLDLIRNRTTAAEKHCFLLLEKPFDFTVDEDLQFNTDSIDWAKKHRRVERPLA